MMENIRKALSDRNLREVSRATGINYFRVWRVATKPDYDPPVSVVEKLSAYLSGN